MCSCKSIGLRGFSHACGQDPNWGACGFLAYLAFTLVSLPSPLLQSLPRYSLLPLRFVPQPRHGSVTPDTIAFPPHGLFREMVRDSKGYWIETMIRSGSSSPSYVVSVVSRSAPPERGETTNRYVSKRDTQEHGPLGDSPN